MSQYQVEYSINLPQPISGKLLIEAVEKIATLLLKKVKVLDNKKLFTIGNSSDDPTEDCVIVADNDIAIDPAQIYEQVVIRYCEWPGMKYAVSYGQEDVERALTNFKDELEKMIAQMLEKPNQ